MKKLEALLQGAGKLDSGEYRDGYKDGIKDSMELIGTCDKCTHAFIKGSGLECDFLVGKLNPEGFCDIFREKKGKEDE